MKLQLKKTIGLCVGAGALIAAIGLSVPAVGVSDVQAAVAGPAHSSPPPPSPTPPPSSSAPGNQEPEYNQGADGGGGGGGG
jgi:hypothetical protein